MKNPLQTELQAVGQRFKGAMLEYLNTQLGTLSLEEKRKAGLAASGQTTVEQAAENWKKAADSMYRDMLGYMLETD